MNPCMKRKQKVGECWVGVIFFACVWGVALDFTNTYDDFLQSQETIYPYFKLKSKKTIILMSCKTKKLFTHIFN
jgi:hypothetical protein